jgi:shikimate kinase
LIALSAVKPNNIALVGFMAVGKSAVGRALARKLKRRFVDLDKIIEKSEGMTISSIFAEKGEAYFRQCEKRELQTVLNLDNQVIATGGGAILDEENLRLLQNRSVLVCLTANPEAIFERVGSGSKRPLLNGDDRRGRIQELLYARQDKYAQAHFSVDTTSLNIAQVTDKIVDLLT